MNHVRHKYLSKMNSDRAEAESLILHLIRCGDSREDADAGGSMGPFFRRRTAGQPKAAVPTIYRTVGQVSFRDEGVAIAQLRLPT